jgi:hypothetical protein
MKSKSEATNSWKGFIVTIKSLNFIVKIVRVDNDSVFLCAKFIQVCQAENWGFVVERTVPYSHWHLARIERQWRILSEGAKTLLISADLPGKFWDHAFMTMVYIHNRTWLAGANGIPLFMITNKMPDLSNLRTFRCPAYAHINQSRMNKFEDNAFKGIFIGYAFDSPEWLIYNPVTQRVTRTRNVTFDKEWKSASTTLPPFITNDYDSDDNDSSVPGEQEPASPKLGVQEPAIPNPGEQQPSAPPQPELHQPPKDKTMRRVAQLLKDIEAAIVRMEREPRRWAENRRVDA